MMRRNRNDNEPWFTTLWLGATRYYLGRKTYAVGDFCAGLGLLWEHLPDKTRALIARDIDAAFAADDEARANRSGYLPLGHDCDREEWARVRALWFKQEEK